MSSSQYFTQHQMQDGVVLPQVLNRCPPGTKVHVLCVGYLQADEGFMLRGANTSTMSNPDGPPKNKRRDLVMYVVLIDHPTEGLILFETGCGKDYPEVWGAPLNDIFARTRYEEEHELDVAIAKAGYNIKDVKMVIIGHLHLDHAGGLDKFWGTDVPIWVHKEELLSAFYSVSTGADAGVYLPTYMKTEYNWKTWDERHQDLAAGITMHHLPGHTEGLCGLQINLINDGTYIFVSDHGHVKENIWSGIPQGWLARNHQAWFNSNQRLLMMEKLQKAKIIPGHDEDIAKPLFGKVLT